MEQASTRLRKPVVTRSQFGLMQSSNKRKAVRNQMKVEDRLITMAQRRALPIALSTLLLVFAAGCHKKVPPPPPPPPAPAPAPAPSKQPTVNYFTAEPSTISPGHPSSLRWSVTDA